MKKMYENPVAEKIVFDYTSTVVASGTVSTQYKSTMDKKCEKIIDEPKPTKVPIVTEKPTEGIVVKCVV